VWPGYFLICFSFAGDCRKMVLEMREKPISLRWKRRKYREKNVETLNTWHRRLTKRFFGKITLVLSVWPSLFFGLFSICQCLQKDRVGVERIPFFVLIQPGLEKNLKISKPGVDKQKQNLCHKLHWSYRCDQLSFWSVFHLPGIVERWCGRWGNPFLCANIARIGGKIKNLETGCWQTKTELVAQTTLILPVWPALLLACFLFAGDCRKMALDLKRNRSSYAKKGGNKEKKT